MLSIIHRCVCVCVYVHMRVHCHLQLELQAGEGGVPTAGAESCPNLLTLSVVAEKHQLCIPALTTPERSQHFSSRSPLANMELTVFYSSVSGNLEVKQLFFPLLTLFMKATSYLVRQTTNQCHSQQICCSILDTGMVAFFSPNCLWLHFFIALLHLNNDSYQCFASISIV